MLSGVKDAQGKEYFQQQARNARGAIRRLDDGRHIVGLFKKKDLSTVLHESAHFWLEQLREAAGLEGAPDWVRDSWGKLQAAYGFDGFLDGDANFTAWEKVQERFARDFEAYAREGKAPSNELQAAFNKFCNWLTDIYVHIRRLLGDGDLSEDVREVFDRLLATEEEVQVSRRAVPQNVMAEIGDAASPELQGRYARAAQKAYDNASALIAARRLVEQRRAEKEFREAATEKVDADPFYRLVAAVREEGGISFDSMKDLLPEDTAYTLRDKWQERGIKGFIKKQGVLDVLDVAARFNQDSAINLAGLLLDAPSRSQAIEAETQRSLAEWESDFDGSIEYSNAMDEALAVELEALTGHKQVSPSVLRAEFERRVGIRKSADVDAEYNALKASLRKQNSVLRAALKEWRAAANAEAREARDAARERLAAVREQERLKRAALGAAYRARIERAAIVRQVRRAASSKSVEYAYQQQILRLVAHWKGLGTPAMTPRDVQGMPAFQEFMAENVGLFPDEEGLIADWIYAESGRGKAAYLGDLSLEQLRELKTAIKVLEHKGRQYGRLIAQGRNTEARLAVDAMRESADTMTAATLISERDREGFFGKVRGFLRGAVADLTAVDMLCRALNGYSKDGPFTQYIVLPLRRAMSAEFRLKREFDARLASVLTPLAREGSGKAFQIAGVPLPDDVSAQWGGLFDRDKVISVALNMGNAGNLKAVMRGYGWSEGDLRAITAGMTVAEWQAIQNVWDMIDELYPGLAGAYERIHGVPLAKVQAQAFTVQAADGVVSLKGGYYPLIFDRNFSRQAEDAQTRDEIMNRMEAITRTANPKSGMTNERKGGTLPPKLSLRVLQQHIADTIHYTTHAEALRDVAQLTRRSDFKTMFERAAGVDNYKLLLPWLQHVARPGTEMLTQYDKMAEWMARRGSLVALALNMKTALMQLTSFGNSMNEIGAGQFMKGVYQMMSRGRIAYDEVRAKSAYMESRSRNFDASIAEQLERFSPLGAGGVSFMGRRFTLKDVQDSQLALIQALDAVVSYPTWIGAYDAAIAGGMAEEDAISSADDAVIAAQSSGAAMDTPALLRRRGFIKLATSFMSFANRDFNRKKYYLGGFREYLRGGNSAIDFTTFARHLALEWVLPVVLPVLILSLGRDGELPKSEEFAWEALGFLTMGIPFLRDAARGIDAFSTGKGYGTRMGGSTKELVNTMGFFTGVGTPQIWRTAAGSEADFVDDEGGPLAPLLGKPKK